MSRERLLVCLLALAGSGSVLLAERSITLTARFSEVPDKSRVQSHVARSVPARLNRALSMPMTFEPNVGQASPLAEFIGRGRGMTVLLEHREIEVLVAGATKGIRLRLMNGSDFHWRAEEKLLAESNYFMGRDPQGWHSHVPHFARVEARNIGAEVGIVVYGNDDGLEYDLRVAPGGDASQLRLKVTGADDAQLNSAGDLMVRVGKNEMRMRRPAIYEEPARASRRAVDGGYVLAEDGTVRFRIGEHDRDASIVIDPTLSVAYATFLGGAGADASTSMALDSEGKVYVGGTATSASTFAETSSTLGPGGGATELFVAKIDPQTTGASSLLYLTFIGGSGKQSGGKVALDSAKNVVILGSTTSADFPVTDSSVRTSGANDVTVSEIDPTGSKLFFSTLFGGSGAESQNSLGAIAVDSLGRAYIASDTTSQDLAVTPRAFQPTWDGQPGDAFFAVFAPPASPGGAATLQYCSYLGTNSNVTPTVGGIAVDRSGNAFIAGSTANGVNGFPTKNAMQTAYGGGDSDAFLMKVSPGGQGGIDLVYSTLLGGSGADQALAVAVDRANPPNAYVTGTTQSSDFPMNSTVAGFQTSLHANATANSFLAVVNQNAQTAMTSLAYATYLGGSATDAGLGIAVPAANAVYLSGTTASWDFPWHDNLQPFNGAGDVFVAKLDPTQAGSASLIYATPLGGTSPPGAASTAAGNGIAADGNGNVFVAGDATAADFPTALTTGASVNGFQPACASCQQSPAVSDAFVVRIAESNASSPSVYFNTPRVNFPVAPIGTQNAPQLVAVLNGGDSGANLTISNIQITPSGGDFSLIGQASCIGKPINPGPTPQCSFEVGFTASFAGTETAAISVTDNAPGSPQLLEVSGSGAGLVPAPTSLVFPDQPQGTTSNPESITLTNSSSQQIVIDSGPSAGSGAATGFQLAGAANNCAASQPISPGSACVISVTFTPQSTGPAIGNVDLTYNLQGGPQVQLAIPLSGTGTTPAPVVGISPASLDLEFGTVAVGTMSGAQTVKLQNQGSAALSLTGIGLTGANPADFAIVSTGTTCPTSSGTVAIGQGCAVAVQFAPQSGGAKSAKLSISDNAAGSPQVVTLNGTAAAPASLQVSPSTLPDFGQQSEGISSAPQTLTIANTGSSAADISQVAVSGPNAHDFPLTDSCAPSLAAGKSCQISVAFNPATAMPSGSRSATLNIPGASPSSIALSGTATQAAVSVPTSVNFGSQLAGTAGSAQPINVTNTGNGALVVNTASMQGTNSGDFVIGSDECVTGSTPPNASCAIQVTFKPGEGATCGASPSRSATLTLADNAASGQQSIPLSGTAEDFCFVSQSGENISSPIPPGQTAIYSLEIDSTAGFTGSVGLSCSGAPPMGTCSIVTNPATNPASVNVTANAPGQFTVNVTTTAGVPGAPFGVRRNPTGRVLTLVIVLAVICYTLLAARFSQGTRGTTAPNLIRVAQGTLVIVVFILAMASCGGGGTSDPNPAGTPAGTYTVTVTATPAGGGTSRQIPLTFTVN